MNDSLPIAVLHLDVRHGALADNRASLVAHAEEAAARGARIIVAPELAVSGYGFDSRNEITPFVEDIDGDTLGALASVARRFGVYCCTGFAEREKATAIYYNSAAVLGPDGSLVAHHRKRVAERRWSCPGQSSTANIFSTPWGKVGVLVCADAYYGLLPRGLALRDVDLLLTPANWPPLGIDAREVWRARALENGIGVVGANRTGLDRRMDCRKAPSYVTTPEGKVLLDATSPQSCIHLVEYPLDRHRLPSRLREEMIAVRRPWDYDAVALDGNGLEQYPGVWGVPMTGRLTVRCVVPPPCPFSLPDLAAGALHGPDGVPTVVLLPPGAGHLSVREAVGLVEGRPAALVMETAAPTGERAPAIVAGGSLTIVGPDMNAGVVDFGPARIALVRPEGLVHPEQAVALSKQGCDVIVSQVTRLGEDERLAFGVKCLERVVVAVTAPDGAMICEPPEAHERWRETSRLTPGVCETSFGTERLRKKRFLDRVDLEALLRR